MALVAHQWVFEGKVFPKKWIIFLHGFLGSGRNLLGFSKKLQKKLPQHGILLPDLRLHGKNYDEQGHALQEGPHTIRAAAQDVAALVPHLNLDVEFIIGHSLGGKIALELAPLLGRAPKKIMILDSTPFPVTGSRDSQTTLHILRQLHMPMSSRNEVIFALKSLGLSAEVSQWLAMNLVERPDGVYWALDFAKLDELLLDFYRLDHTRLITHLVERVPIHFVKALNSDAVKLEDLLKLPGVETHTVPGGHWVHVSAENELLTILAKELPH